MSAIAARLSQAARQPDKVLLAIVLLFAALAVAAPDQARISIGFVVQSLLGVAPFLLAAVAMAAYAKASGADNLIARAFTGRLVPMVIMASLVGALSPFCSCGVIPLIAALLVMGVPLPAVMAFWLASPLMDPSMFLLTLGTLGLGFALFKTFAAVALGLIGGFGTALLMHNGAFTDPLRPEVGNGGCGGAKIRNPKAVVWRFWEEPARTTTFVTSGRDTVLFLGKWLTLAFLLESLMIAWIPAEQVAATLGGDGILPVITAVLVGVPAYLNGYAALPLIGGLMGQGMTPGAGMAFLIAGGVTSMPAAIAVWALARPPVFLAYVGFSLGGALALGLLFNSLA
jgi:uncharacterized membrane protein YraQ (UPF0718 family)